MDNNFQNNYIVCPRCQQNIPYGSSFCNRCGLTLIYQQQPQEPTPQYKKESPLSVVAAILAITFTLPGVIVGIIDLASSQSKQNDNYKHGCSWFAVIFGIILMSIYYTVI